MRRIWVLILFLVISCQLSAFYLDSYLGLAKRENTLQSGSFISAIVEAKIEENKELQGERIFH